MKSTRYAEQKVTTERYPQWKDRVIRILRIRTCAISRSSMVQYMNTKHRSAPVQQQVAGSQDRALRQRHQAQSASAYDKHMQSTSTS